MMESPAGHSPLPIPSDVSTGDGATVKSKHTAGKGYIAFVDETVFIKNTGWALNKPP